jgi:hypothetical protein
MTRGKRNKEKKLMMMIGWGGGRVEKETKE